MRRRQFMSACAVAAGLGAARGAWALTETDAAAAVRAALTRGADRAVGTLGRPDGFFGDPRLRIPLPPALDSAATLLRRLGQGRQVDELVVGMNRAAEAAVPLARPLLIDAVRSMSVEDAVHLVRGGDTAVTDFFATKTRVPLTARFLPIVAARTRSLDLAARYDALASKGRALGLVKAEDASVDQYVTRKAIDGLFMVIGEEERRIRSDPVATGSALLRAAFGR